MVKLITWNINFWQNYRNKEWKDNFAQYLLMLMKEYDFILLQESNPSLIFNKDENQFEIDDKVVYFNKFLIEEIGIETDKKIIPWGNSIIANKEFPFIKNNFLDKKGHIENYYFGKSAFMCYDFKLDEKRNITIFNFYNKNQNGQYPMLKTVISDIEKVLKNNKNIVILSGDFNSDMERDPNNKEFFNQLSQLGLVNCTDDVEFETTMVPEIGIKRQYPNDKIFVKKPWDKYIVCKLIKNTTIELSDHRPIECTIRYFPETDRCRNEFLQWWNN